MEVVMNRAQDEALRKLKSRKENISDFSKPLCQVRVRGIDQATGQILIGLRYFGSLARAKGKRSRVGGINKDGVVIFCYSYEKGKRKITCLKREVIFEGEV